MHMAITHEAYPYVANEQCESDLEWAYTMAVTHSHLTETVPPGKIATFCPGHFVLSPSQTQTIRLWTPQSTPTPPPPLPPIPLPQLTPPRDHYHHHLSARRFSKSIIDPQGINPNQKCCPDVSSKSRISAQGVVPNPE